MRQVNDFATSDNINFHAKRFFLKGTVLRIKICMGVMMKLEQIEVTIDSHGKVKLQTSGFSGDDCITTTQELEALLGNQLLQRERTFESYEQTVGKTSEKLKIHGAS